MSETEERAALVAEAMTWRGTRYHDCARVKGAGADCLTFLAGVFENAGLVPKIDIPYYPPDWHLHRAEERYMTGLLQYCVESDPASAIALEPLPGDVLLYKVGRCFSHGALVVAYPQIIHAVKNIGVVLGDAQRDGRLTTIGENGVNKGKPRARRHFALRRWVAA